MNAIAINLDDIYPVRIDWVQLFVDLDKFGWTPYRVAMTLGADTSTVYHWAEGHEPRHRYGAAVVALHKAVCGEEYSTKLYSESRMRL